MGKVLIAYYSRRGENYVNGSIVNLKLGNTEVVAQKIKALLPDADVFQIDTTYEYSKSYMTCIEEAKQELRDQARPEVKNPLESMAAAAQAVHNYFSGKVIYINVMNNMSVDCDCDGHPAKPELKDMGIMASLDPVAVDQACLDMVFNYQGKPGDDNKPLIQRINRQHGTYITDYAERIGLGSKKYELIRIDK